MAGPSDKKPLGRILVQHKLVTQDELSSLLEKQRAQPGTRLASTVAQSGKLDEVELLRALSEQAGVPGIDLTQVVVPLANLKLVPADVAKQYLILPFSVSADEMLLAMADPHDRRVIEEIEFVSGRTVQPYIALHELLQRVLSDAYRLAERGDAYYIGPNAPAEYLQSLGLPADAGRPEEATRPTGRPMPKPTERTELRDGRADPRVDPKTPVPESRPEPPRVEARASAPERPEPPKTDPKNDLRQAISRRGPTIERALSDFDADKPIERSEPQRPFFPEPSAASPGTGAAQALVAAARRRDLSALDPAFESRVARLPTEESTKPRGDGAARKVLIVDDEDDIRRLLKRVLSEKGYDTVEASRGTEALQAVRDHAPDVILLDAMLPEIHGFELCRRIRSSQRFGHTPIVMVSAIYRGWRFAEDLRESFGVTEFLEKPFKISEVVAAVERALSGAQGLESEGDAESIGSEAGAALERGMAAYKRGDLDAAIRDIKEGVGLEPGSFRLRYHLGLLYGRRDELFEAIQEMELAVGLAPKNFAALKNLAVLYQRAGFKHKAIEVWERTLPNAPDEEARRGIKEHLMSLL